MGYAIFAENNGKVCSLEWKSGKIKRIVKSTLAAEALALSEGIGEAMFLQRILRELLGRPPTITAYTDSKGLVNQLHSTKLVLEKILRIDIGIIKQMLEREEIEEVKWCPTEEQPADVLTKRGALGNKLVSMLKYGQK